MLQIVSVVDACDDSSMNAECVSVMSGQVASVSLDWCVPVSTERDIVSRLM